MQTSSTIQMATNSTLAKWGNSQGVRIPKDICDRLGLQVGCPVILTVDQENYEVTLVFSKEKKAYRRRSVLSLEELCAGWSEGKVGEGKVGEEWGGEDVGAEVVD